MASLIVEETILAPNIALSLLYSITKNTSYIECNKKMNNITENEQVNTVLCS